MSLPPPATIEDHVFPIVRIAANPNFNPQDDHLLDGEVDSQISVNDIPGEQRRFMVELRVKVLPKDGKNIPYFIDVIGISFVTVDDEVAEPEIKRTAAIAGHMVLYPAIREMIISVTARQPWGKFSIGFSVLGSKADIAQPPPTERPVTKRRRRKE